MDKRELFVEETCTKFLIELGIPANLQGFRYLRRAISFVVDNEKLLTGITKALYPKVAENFSVSPSVVERSIRHCIEVATDRQGMEGLNDIFGVVVYPATYKPSNSEIISLLSDKICLLLNEKGLEKEEKEKVEVKIEDKNTSK